MAQPSMRGFGQALRQSARAGNVQETVARFNELKERRMRITYGIYKDVITMFARGGHPQRAAALLHECLAEASVVSDTFYDYKARKASQPQVLVPVVVEKIECDLVEEPVEIAPLVEKPPPLPWDLKSDLFEPVVDGFARVGDHANARHWLERCSASSVLPSMAMYGSVCHAFGKANDADGARNFVDTMISNELSPDAQVYQALMMAYSKNSDAKGIQVTLAEMKKRGLDSHSSSSNSAAADSSSPGNNSSRSAPRVVHHPEVLAVNSLIHSCALRSDFNGAIKHFNSLQKKNLQPDVASFNGVLDALGRNGRGKQAEAWLGHLLRAKVAPNVLSYNYCLIAHAKAGDGAACEAMLRRMEREGFCMPNMISYNALFSGLAKTGDIDKCMRYLDRMIQAGGRPDQVSMNTILQAFGSRSSGVQMRHIESENTSFKQLGAEKFVVDMKMKFGVAANIQTYNVLIDILVKAPISSSTSSNPSNSSLGSSSSSSSSTSCEFTKGIEKYLHEMRVAGFRPTPVTYSSIINGYARRSDVNGAKNMWKRMLSDRVKVSDRAFTGMIRVFSSAGELNEAKAWLDKMRDELGKVDAHAYGCLLEGYSIHGDVDGATKIFEQMQTKDNIVPNEIIYTSLITSCAKRGDSRGAAIFLNQMNADPNLKRQSVRPDIRAYTAVVDACAKNGDVKGASRWILRAMRAGALPTIVTFTAVLHSCAKVGDIATGKRWIQRMDDWSMSPNLYCYNTIIHLFAKNGCVEEACFYFNELVSAGYTPTEISYNNVIQAFTHANDQAGAIAWMEKLADSGTMPNMATFSHVLQRLKKEGGISPVEDFDESADAF